MIIPKLLATEELEPNSRNNDKNLIKGIYFQNLTTKKIQMNKG